MEIKLIEDEHAAWKHPKTNNVFFAFVDVCTQHAHDQDNAEQKYIYITIKMSMQHGNVQKPTREFSF